MKDFSYVSETVNFWTARDLHSQNKLLEIFLTSWMMVSGKYQPHTSTEGLCDLIWLLKELLTQRWQNSGIALGPLGWSWQVVCAYPGLWTGFLYCFYVHGGFSLNTCFSFTFLSNKFQKWDSYSSSHSPAKTQNLISYLFYSTDKGKGVDIKILLAQVLDLKSKSGQLQTSGHSEWSCCCQAPCYFKQKPKPSLQGAVQQQADLLHFVLIPFNKELGQGEINQE